jgi:hypothetical protein
MAYTFLADERFCAILITIAGEFTLARNKRKVSLLLNNKESLLSTVVEAKSELQITEVQ